MLSTRVPSMSKRKAAKVRSVSMAGSGRYRGLGVTPAVLAATAHLKRPSPCLADAEKPCGFVRAWGKVRSPSGGKRMGSAADLVVKAALVGIGGTIVLDLWALFMARVMGLPATNWAMVGRWFGNMPRGQFVQATMTKARPVEGELAIGWIAHYAIGIGYGLLLPAFWGQGWLDRPTLLPPMILAWVLLAA